MRAPLRYFLLTAGATVAVAATAQSQGVDASLSLSGGAATDQRGMRSNAVSIAPSLLFTPDPRLSFTLSGSATRFESSDWATSGTAGAGARLPLPAGFALAASTSGSAVETSYGARYLTLDLTPTLEATLGRLTLFGGAHVAQGTARLSAERAPTLPLGGAPRPGESSRVTRTGSGPVYGAILASPGSRPDAGSGLSFREERMRVQGVTVLDRALGVGWTGGGHAIGATLGIRDATDEQVTHGEVRGSLGVSRGLALLASVGSYPSSRTLGTPGGRYATLGIVLRNARADTPAPARAGDGLPRAARGTTRLVLHAPEARRVELAGDWNKWATRPATRAQDGRWYVDVRLPRGEYRYAFRIDGERWAVPDGVATLDDGFGGRSALLTVP